MRGFSMVLCLVVLLGAVLVATSSEVTAADPTQAAWGAAATVPAAVVSDPGGFPAPMKFKAGLSRKQRRSMGLTFRGVRKAITHLQGTGDITEDMSTEEVSVVVTDYLIDANPPAFGGGVGERDWDSFFDFLERLINLIMKLFAMA